VIKARLSAEILSQFKAALAAAFPSSEVHCLFKIVAAAADLGQALDASHW